MSALPGYPTLLDIAIRNGSDQVTGLIDETTRLAPEVRLGSSRTIPGTSYKTNVRVGLPSAPFRNANQGGTVTKSRWENREIGTFIMNPRFEADIAVADRYEFGAAEFISDEMIGIMEAAIQSLGRQFYYGRHQYSAPFTDQSGMIPNTNVGANATYGGDLLGFPGLIDGYNSTLYQVDALGTTTNTCSSVWGVKFGTQNVTWVWGKDGQLQMRDITIQRVLDSASNPFDAYCSSLLAYPGLQIGDIRSVVRIKNVSTDSGKGLTDNLLYTAMALLPAGLQPDMWLMSRRSWNQLRQSRTATNIIGAPPVLPTAIAGVPQASVQFGAASPPPTESSGVLIFPTDSIANTEPLNFLGL